MSDLDPTTPTPPIAVPNSAVPSQISTLLRDLTIVLTALPALLAVLGTRDLLHIIAYVRSVEFAPALGVIVGAGVLLWRQINARRAVKKLQIMEPFTPTSISYRKGSEITLATDPAHPSKYEAVLRDGAREV